MSSAVEVDQLIGATTDWATATPLLAKTICLSVRSSVTNL